MIPTTKFLFPIFLIIIFFLRIDRAESQINLESIENFSLYTNTGAVSNTSTSYISNDIGTNSGAISGFGPPSVVKGSIQNTNAISSQAALDLNAVVVQINTAVTTDTHLPVFGSETLTPGVYYQAGAASIAGTLTLDAQGDPNAEFIFKIGGALSTAAGTTVVLINCASSDKIFWLSGGAISMAASTTISGNLISNPGAVDIGSGGKITGRMLSTTGAISVYGSEVDHGIPRVGNVTQPTCGMTSGSFQIINYNATSTYTFTPSVVSISGTGLVTANANTYTFTVTNAGGCSPSVGSVNVVITPTINYWTGATSSDWNDAGNWTCGTPTTLNDLINIIPVVTTYPIIGAEPDNAGLAKNLEIQSGASLNIISNSLQVTTNLMLNGKIDLEGGSQLLQNTGSIFDAASTGSIEIDQQGTGNNFRYNYWSSPVHSIGANYTIGDVLNDGTDPNAIKTIDFDAPYTYADGIPSSPIKLSTYWMYKLEDSNLGYSAWTRVGNSGDLKVGQGYSMKGSNTDATEQNYTFLGQPNNGIIELTIGANNEYLIGNPYPSAIDANKFIDDNGLALGTGSITGTIYLGEHYGGDTHYLADYQGGYATYSKGGAISASSNPPVPGMSTIGTSVKGVPKQYIPAGQGFFVVGDADGGQIQFNNSQRVFIKESSGNSIFMKSNNSKSETATMQGDDFRPKFRIGFDSPELNHHQILLTLDKNTSDAVDWGYDAEIYEVSDNDIYWDLDNKKYAIQVTNEFGFDKEIPIGIQTKTGGLISINVDELENVEKNTSLYIKDILTGETHDITNKTFEINLEAGEYKNRFLLVFQSLLKTTEAVALFEGVDVYMNNSISKLELNRIADIEILNVSLFNFLGQQVKAWSIKKNEPFISLPLQTASGVYIVIVETLTGKVKKKIIIY
ncbi:ice-binding family protein [Algibacter sp. L1A34]|uniref:ice-binding family protein n=1 Tax=Algibacter sp. L1A34 TaxID=2686365 RepID=UPI00131D3006|nr:ice-binding family protein [Algibacter sp. L1A34]